MLQSGTFEKSRLLGRGKYSDVFLDENNSRVIKEAKNKAVQSLRHIDNEYQKLKHLKESKIAPNVYFLKEDEDGIPSLVMDYIPGKTLRSYLDQCEGLDQKLESQFALNLVDKLITYVERLHTQFKMAHFDLSPDNIMIKGKEIYLIDFSLSRFEGEFSLMKEPVGKIAYMAPEAFEREYGYYTDIYALGIMIQEIIVNSHHHPLFDKFDYVIASMKIDRPEVRASIEEVATQFRQFKKKNQFNHWYWIFPLLMTLFFAFIWNSSTEKDVKEKTSMKRKVTKPKKVKSTIVKKKNRKPEVKRNIVKKERKRNFSMDNETKNIFRKITK